ncbi:ATP-dependent DNA helicase DinG [Carnobacterium gallinarum]|uniref:ATP-dependent DNA helicase DinG n=1 Tax=Carnobacterium gallinarum TaxID=2749 RepID=UPI000555DFF6|nr:ATP-dependent DNA helicase DinG [Carnobacterium gallinarum]
MEKVKTYAVVDIETTGGNVENGDKIIQFGCVLLEDGKIVQQFATDINPGVRIPKQIEYLTGISTKQVANAPYFEDVATTIYNLLADCVFIAHNIQFDYQFLDGELQNCGLPPLKLKGMDTVELAQILVPTAASFRLTDLATQFEFKHENPHQADSDAYVTAQLFLLLNEKAKKLPLVTLEKILELAQHCSMDTVDFFVDCLAELRLDLPKLSESIMIKNGLAIQQKAVEIESRNHREVHKYPVSQEAKANLFKNKLKLRTAQIDMMDALHAYLSQAEERELNQHMAIEAATGVGKTLGYLIPLAYHGTPEKPIMVSTYTTLLQKQLLEKDIAQLSQILPFQLSATIIKSKSHYLHLAKYEAELKKETVHKNDALVKMRLLVWLTMTKTGDLDELNLSNYNQPIWQRIRHRGWLASSIDDPWLAEDFYLFAKKQAQHASIIITNHAFLCHDLQRELPELPLTDTLIIDEAHHLADVATSSSSEVFNYYGLLQAFRTLGKLDIENSYLQRLDQLQDQLKIGRKYQLASLEMSVWSLEEQLSDFIESLLAYCGQQLAGEQIPQEQVELLVNHEIVWPLEVKKAIKQIGALFTEIIFISEELLASCLKAKEQLIFDELYFLDSYNQLLTTLKKNYLVFQTVFQENNENSVNWFAYNQKSAKNSFKIRRSRLDSGEFLREHLVKKVGKIIYTGATLEIKQSFDYFANQIGESQLETMILPSPYDYGKQARLYLPKEMKPIKSLSKKQYIQAIVDNFAALATDNNENMLVLFNSLETLKEVYYYLQKQALFSEREILAQGISGSRERILKRFFHATGGILLGADSFWEGVDLPGKALRMIVITRLPFDSPEQPYTKANYQQIAEKGQNPFTVATLPKATLRLRQGLGRLIRSEEDKGVMLILDDRLFKTNYGLQMLKALPENLPKEELPLAEIVEKAKEFLR